MPSYYLSPDLLALHNIVRLQLRQYSLESVGSRGTTRRSVKRHEQGGNVVLADTWVSCRCILRYIKERHIETTTSNRMGSGVARLRTCAITGAAVQGSMHMTVAPRRGV